MSTVGLGVHGDLQQPSYVSKDAEILLSLCGAGD